MGIANELAALFDRDLTRLLQQLQAFAEGGALWDTSPGMVNSAGNLMLHLEGNLREYVCRLLGHVPYRRVRTDEFTLKGIPKTEMVARLEDLRLLVPGVIRGLTNEQLEAEYPENPLGGPIGTQQFLIHLYGHLSYHLGQIDSLRRLLSRGSAIPYARL